MTGDVYPGDAAYRKIVQSIYKGVTSDAIQLQAPNISSPQTRSGIAQLLVDTHNSKQNSGQAQTNADFLGITLTTQEVTQALIQTQGYSSSSGWASWAGRHSGTWYDKGECFTDNARWLTPVAQTTQDPKNDLDRNSKPRVYDFQKAEFLNSDNSIRRNGWNQSHPEILYLWGWDPKEQGNANGQIGTHVGFPFTKNNTQVIVWFTPREAFLECVTPVGAGLRKRTSTGLEGFGQWTVT